MQRSESAWSKDGDWKARYSKLYSSRCSTSSAGTSKETPNRISFMTNDATPYASLLKRMRENPKNIARSEETSTSTDQLRTLLAHRSETYGSIQNYQRNQSDDQGINETKLLDMVRASQSKNVQDKLTEQVEEIQQEDTSDEDTDTCVHILNMRTTERSVSRSRFSRISTRRDMDIPSILAYTTTFTAPEPLEIPAFANTRGAQPEKGVVPRWSIRKHVCPVCSQKWKDRSTIRKVRNSGLKRNSSQDFPSVKASARLTSAITMAYVPRPALPVVDEDGPGYAVMRHSSATWQLTRARKFRTPKLQQPPPEAMAVPVAAAPLAQKDLDTRVNKFLKDEI